RTALLGGSGGDKCPRCRSSATGSKDYPPGASNYSWGSRTTRRNTMATKTAAAHSHVPAHDGISPKMQPTRNDLPLDLRRRVITILNQQLADTSDLRSQTKHAHWNVKGPNFIALHKLFDELVDQLSEYVDDIAERATALGGVAGGTSRVVA